MAQPETVNDSVEDRLTAVERRLAASAASATKLNGELKAQTAGSSAPRAAATEHVTAPPVHPAPPIHSSAEAVEELNQRLSQRIARLESQVAEHSDALAGHADAIGELRSCSLRNEESVRRLLAGIERLIDAQGPAHAAPLRTVKPSGSSAA
jgi:uncharacterized coiled-coil protein SlyX